MNRRQFFRSGAAFGVALAVAPSMALATHEASVEAADYAAGCPGYAAILEDLKVGYLNVFPDADLTIDTTGFQWLSVMARNHCDTCCTLSRLYDAFTPPTAAHAELGGGVWTT